MQCIMSVIDSILHILHIEHPYNIKNAIPQQGAIVEEYNKCIYQASMQLHIGKILGAHLIHIKYPFNKIQSGKV